MYIYMKSSVSVYTIQALWGVDIMLRGHTDLILRAKKSFSAACWEVAGGNLYTCPAYRS